MSSLKNEIVKTLKNKPDGMSARAIANIIQTTRSSVNSLLYAHPEDFIKDDSYVPLWRLAEDSYSDFEETDPIMLKLQNRTESKEFTQEYFDSYHCYCLIRQNVTNRFPQLL